VLRLVKIPPWFFRPARKDRRRYQVRRGHSAALLLLLSLLVVSAGVVRDWIERNKQYFELAG
jgi:hypothetical protein